MDDFVRGGYSVREQQARVTERMHCRDCPSNLSWSWDLSAAALTGKGIRAVCPRGRNAARNGYAITPPYKYNVGELFGQSAPMPL